MALYEIVSVYVCVCVCVRKSIDLTRSRFIETGEVLCCVVAAPKYACADAENNHCDRRVIGEIICGISQGIYEYTI